MVTAKYTKEELEQLGIHVARYAEKDSETREKAVSIALKYSEMLFKEVSEEQPLHCIALALNMMVVGLMGVAVEKFDKKEKEDDEKIN